MSDFKLFEQALNEYENTTSSEYSDDDENIPKSCLHSDVVNENGIITCVDCGEEIKKTIQHEKEWRYYGQSDTKRSDPNRVQIRKSEDRNIYKDVESMSFSEKIVSSANKIYCDTTKGQIFRGNSRKAIIFACIFHAYKLAGKPQPHEKLIRIFSLNRKTGLKGLKHVNLHAPKDSKIHTTYITPVNLVENIMDQFSASDSQKKEVITLYSRIKNKSSKLNRARPQSVSSGLVFYWICKKKIDINIKEFAAKANLSELTISKISKEVATVLNTPGIV
jgi:transcription initiation factor TFIIIB Brf1 subunit/transcription initiation factor TFIIB